MEVLGGSELHAACGASGAEPVFRVTVPTWRRRARKGRVFWWREIISASSAAPLPTTLPEGKTVEPQRNPLRQFVDEVRDILAASGLHEIICYSLTDEPTMDESSPRRAPGLPGGRGTARRSTRARLVNTLRSDWAMLRPRR